MVRPVLRHQCNNSPAVLTGKGNASFFCSGNYIYKFVVALLLTPVIYLVHNWIEKYLGASLASEMKKSAMERN